MNELSYVHGASDKPLLGEPIFANLRRTAERVGDREALVVPYQRYRATYRELVAQCEEIARGLMAHPKLLLLDEPSLGLAPLIVQQLFQTITGIRRQGTTVLLVEQNAHMALSIGDRGYVLETGRLVAEGDPEALWNNDEVRAAYLGGRKMVR